jgi:hypothetical protein
MDNYEIRRQGYVVCHGSVKNLGYSPELLKDMARNGLYLYINGKRVKV